MLALHAVIGLGEGLMTAVIVGACDALEEKSRRDVLLVLSVVCAGGVSLLASVLPDGLEYSLMASSFTPASPDALHAAADFVQAHTSLLPDYAVSSLAGSLSQVVAGLAGVATLLVAVLATSRIVARH